MSKVPPLTCLNTVSYIILVNKYLVQGSSHRIYVLKWLGTKSIRQLKVYQSAPPQGGPLSSKYPGRGQRLLVTMGDIGTFLLQGESISLLRHDEYWSAVEVPPSSRWTFLQGLLMPLRKPKPIKKELPKRKPLSKPKTVKELEEMLEKRRKAQSRR